MLNKMVLKGFKSFQRTTAIPFFPGFTAIVGANGTGKSNILDALVFVLGHRSAKIRAEKLVHLIYNGGKGKKPADHAIVTLHLKNNGGVFDEFFEGEAPEEITIGRKVTRAGNSIYKFMGKNCKRELIDRILNNANLDPDGYSFIKQGKITEIVKRSPVERRKIIEDISGIASYKEKKEKALSELETVDKKLTEHEILLEERKNHLENLKAERDAAQKYKELENERVILKKAVLEVRESALKEIISKIKKRTEESARKKKELEEKLEKADKILEDKEAEFKKIEGELDKERDVSLFREIEQLKNSILRKKDLIESKRNEINNLRSALSEIEAIRNRDGMGGRAVNAVLELNMEGVYGKLSDLISVPEKFCSALSVAMGSHHSDIVVDSRETAIKCVNYIKERKMGRIRLLPLNQLTVGSTDTRAKIMLKMPGVINLAINLVEFDPRYERAVKYVLRDILVAEDLESVKNAKNVHIVTLDGDVLSRGGAITGGSKIKPKAKFGSFNTMEKTNKIRALEAEIESLRKEIGDLNNLLEAKRAEEEKESNLAKELKNKRKSMAKELEDLKHSRRMIYEELIRIKNRRGDADITRLEEELRNVIREKKNYVVEVDNSYLKHTPEYLERKRMETIAKLNEMGPVNLKAIEDYETFRKEVEEFREKMNKIREEKAEIELLIRDIDSRKREKFYEALTKVSGSFAETFKKLFEGGEAYLELEDPDDIESGLLIKAHPPNKKAHTIDGLSGGEKTLTAVAFLLSIQEYKRSPFYILDEIDADLDTTNAHKLSKFIKERSKNWQFIVISHNEETVRHSDRAYGLSMREGVSSIRSIELN